MKETVQEYIKQNKLLRNYARVLVGLSGGADSVALLLVLRELGYKVYAIHCNFCLRGRESDRDERFVTKLCHKLRVPLRVIAFDTRSHARKQHISLEMAARELRYRYFEEVRAEMMYSAIAVAHHKDDQAETLLLNIIRGTGIRGLAAMHPMNGHIIRPLLCVSRQEILNYLEERGQAYVSDSTNGERDAMRNRIRLDLMPLLKEHFNPNIVETLVRLSENVHTDLDAYKAGVNLIFRDHDVKTSSLRITGWKEKAILPSVLHEWLRGKGFTRSQEKEMMTGAGESGRQWLSRTHVVTLDRGTLQLLPIGYEPQPPVLRQEIVDKIERRSPNAAYFDADALTYPLTIRLTQKGDKIIPFGEQKPRSVQTLLKKTSLSKLARKYAWVVCHGREILWLVGVRASNHYRVTDSTLNIVKLSVSDPGFLPDGPMKCTD